MSSYKPITDTEFRVVHILPGQFNDQVKCVLETRPSGVLTTYEALSYQWGDDSLPRRDIHLAHYYPSPATKPGLTHPSRLLVVLWRLLQSARQLVIRHGQLIQFTLSAMIAGAIWVWLMPFVDSPSWTKYIVPKRLYLAVSSMAGGWNVTKLLENAYRVMKEGLRTKPWRSAGEAHQFLSAAGSNRGLRTTPVAPNLELALRHLRLENKVRTMWIDAICINQQDEDEKKIQVQRMDFIYANAGAVVIWLGDCHGIAEVPPCEGQQDSRSFSCRHETDISNAFSYIRAVTGWRSVLSLFWRQDRRQMFQQGCPGLIAMGQRGWWRRLWVLQEATLGTANVLIQCGQNTCPFEDFDSCQAGILQRNPEPHVRDGLRYSKRFVSLYCDFGCSEVSQFEPKQDLSSLLSRGLVFIIRRAILRHSSDEITSIHRPEGRKKLPADRLLHILLRTAGHFECRDERDRLYAVLGVLGGLEKGRSSIAEFMGIIGSIQTMMAFANGIGDYMKKRHPDWRLAQYLLGWLMAQWAIFYDVRARHWTISRPEYVMTKSTEVIQALEDKTGPDSNRGDFFGALARYIGKKTGSLAFLDACSPGTEGHDDDVPSWAPTWTRKFEDAVYEFSGRKKTDGDAVDRFRFSNDGKTLEISGFVCGVVSGVTTLDSLDQTPIQWDQLPEELELFIPDQLKDGLAQVLKLPHKMSPAALFTKVYTFLAAYDMLRDAIPIWATRLLKDYGHTIVQCTRDGEKTAGFLKAGGAEKGDIIVFVPGCYHQLVLRKMTRQPGDNSLRWKLVGLTFMKIMIDRGRLKGGFSRGEWDELRQERQLRRFAVV